MFLSREIAQYVEYLKAKGFTKRSQEAYWCGARRFQSYLQNEGMGRFDQINRELILNYQMCLMNQKPTLSLNTQRLALTILKHFMTYLVRKNYLLFNPATELEIPRKRERLPQGIMSLREVKRLLKQPDVKDRLGLRNKAIMEVLYACGLRSQELRNLKLNDIDLKERILRIIGGKGEKDRIVPLGKTASKYLEEYLHKSRPTLIKGQEEQTVFMGYKKSPLARNTVSEIVGYYVKKAKLKKHVTPHSLRHTCATHMLKNRASLRHIQVLLGHKSLETTQKYTQVEISDLKRAHQKYHPREQ